METIAKTNRRDFLKLGLATGGGLILGFHWNTSSASSFEVVNTDLQIPLISIVISLFLRMM